MHHHHLNIFLKVAKDVVDQATLGSSSLYLHFTVKPKDPQKLTDLELTFNGMRDEKTLVITSYELQQIQGICLINLIEV